MDYFDRSKKSVLEKLSFTDKSRKGGVDVDALPIVVALNKLDNFYTTSSCSGRISLFRESSSKKKFDSGWVFSKHGEVSLDELLPFLESPSLDVVWFRQEAPIFHVACRSLGDAVALLGVCRDLGLKHSGIIGVSRRVMVEIVFNDKFDCPISCNGSILVSRAHLSFLVSVANSKLRANNVLLRKFLSRVEEQLKNNEKL